MSAGFWTCPKCEFVNEWAWETCHAIVAGTGLATSRYDVRCLGRRPDELGARRQSKAESAEVIRLRRFLARIASRDEITGDGPVESMIDPPVGPAAHELRSRMRMAQRGLDGDEYP